MKKREISTQANCFVVRDESLLKGWDSPIYEWLKSEGFVSWGQKGVFDRVDWVYININSKVFAPGMPGINITSTIGNHAITLDEFKTIYQIYKKYDGLDFMRMSLKEQEEWNEKQKRDKEENRKYWEAMTFDIYCNKVKKILLSQYKGIPADEVPEYVESEYNYIKDCYERQSRPESTAYYLDLMW